ncbi:hypothetical protein CICLE_v10023005mg [Citrus x clementina]|uniref:Uncharacterized protein n=1 Tax=Citrus clementina TaxID=85681 RepID=V4TRV3_CITCL|nr:hypothetical protein CICLE_v10023005mg [Citrus x clementina]
MHIQLSAFILSSANNSKVKDRISMHIQLSAFILSSANNWEVIAPIIAPKFSYEDYLKLPMCEDPFIDTFKPVCQWIKKKKKAMVCLVKSFKAYEEDEGKAADR